MHRKPPTHNAAFTLVELLVTITIISILATTILFGMSGVQNTAKAQRTKSQIKRIHEMLAEKWESYESRSLQFKDVTVSNINPTDPTDPTFGTPTPIDRLAGLRELMRLELPDRITDVKPDEAMIQMTAGLNPTYRCRTGIAQPSANKIFNRMVLSRVANGNYANWTSQYQGAECLYMILAQTQVGDSNGLEFFSEREIGDFDNDGMPEILDAWGNPIMFLRWAPGFTGPSSFQNGQAGTNSVGPDAMDLLEIDPRLTQDAIVENDTYALFPLVFSAGPDGEYGIGVDFEAEALLYRDTGFMDYHSFGAVLASDPYVAVDNNGNIARLGDILGDAAADNITNHDLTTRL